MHDETLGSSGGKGRKRCDQHSKGSKLWEWMIEPIDVVVYMEKRAKNKALWHTC